MDVDRLISARARGVDASAIRRVFNLARSLKDPINLSIGQPDFPVPEAIKAAAIEAIRSDRNGYTVTQGIEPLRQRIVAHLEDDLGWRFGDGPKDAGLLITTGTSGGLSLTAQAILNPGDELVYGDPFFPLYPPLAVLNGATPAPVDMQPDFRLTAARAEAAISAKTKAVLLNSPGNPTGIVATQRDCRELLELCRRAGVLLISDEIYDEFAFAEGRTERTRSGREVIPSPAREPGAQADVLVIRGFGKTYGVTGWRLGYAAGPKPLIEQMAKLQQFSYVNAPSIAQWGCCAAFDVDMSDVVREYQARRDLVVEALRGVTELSVPHGAFYVFPRTPRGMSGQQFFERCLERNLLLLPGGAFSRHDTHVRISLAAPREALQRGVAIVRELMQG